MVTPAGRLSVNPTTGVISPCRISQGNGQQAGISLLDRSWGDRFGQSNCLNINICSNI